MRSEIRRALTHVLPNAFPAADCANPRCPCTRLRRLRSCGLRIHLEGSRYCSPECFEVGLAHQLSRSLKATRTDTSAHRLPLGLLLLARGQVTAEELRHALDCQRRQESTRLGQHLIQLGYVREDQVVSALAQQWACPVLAAGAPLRAPAFSLLPGTLVRRFRVIPIELALETSTLYLALADAVDHSLLYAIERMLGCRTAPCLVSDSVMSRLLESAGAADGPAELRFERTEEPPEMARIVAGYAARLHARQARLARVRELIWVQLDSRSGVYHVFFQAAPRTEPPERVLVKSRAGMPMSGIAASVLPATSAPLPAMTGPC